MVAIPESILYRELVHDEVVELIDATGVYGLGGQLKGTTNNKRKIREVAETAEVNKIALEYQRIYKIRIGRTNTWNVATFGA